MSKVNIKFVVSGGRRLRSAIRGLRGETAKANRKTRAESKKTADEAQKAARKTEKAQIDAAKDSAKAVVDSEKKKQRAQQQTSREEEKQTKASIRRARRRARMAGARRVLAAGATLGAGVAAGVRGAAQTAQGITGVRSQEETIGSMVDTRADFVRSLYQGVRGAGRESQYSTSNGGFQDLTNQLISRASEIGESRGISTQEILGAMSNSQTQFSQLATAVESPEQMDAFMDALDFMAQTAQATGSSIQAVEQASFAMARGLGLNADELDEALSIIAQQALDGSITMEDFATQFPQIVSTFRAARGTGGLDALQEFSGMSQALMSGANATPEMVRTGAAAFMSALSNENVQGRLMREGVDVVDSETGQLRNLGDIVSELQGEGFNLTELNRIFGSQEAARAAAQLVSAETESGLTLNERIGASAEDGRSLIEGGFEAVMGDASGDAISARAERDARLAKNSEELITQFAELARSLSELEDMFPRTSTMGGSIAGGVGAGLGGLSVLRWLRGGAAATAATGAGGAAAGTTTAAGGTAAAGASAGLGATLGVGIAGLAGGLGIGTAMNHLFDAITGGDKGGGNSAVAAQSEAIDSIAQGNFWTEIGQGLEMIGKNIVGESNVTGPGRARESTVRLHPSSITGVAQAVSATAPGSGRRGEGGPGGRSD